MQIEQQHSTFHIPHSTFQQRGIRVLVTAEGSGGHLIPAIEVARELVASGARVCLIYAQRANAAGVVRELLDEAQEHGVSLYPVRLTTTPRRALRAVQRLWQGGLVWRLARAQSRRFQPQLVVGCGGWISVPVILAAKRRSVPILLHEQNVRLGRANRFLLRWADEVAVSFAKTRLEVRTANALVTGLPVRRTIGAVAREEAARRFGLEPGAPTLLVLGGSQGSGPLNRVICGMLRALGEDERASWQFIHLTGASDGAAVRQEYAAAGVRGWVAPHLEAMGAAYALADVVVSRAGASTIAELAACGIPALLIPYPYARGHQRDNARLVESAGAAVLVEEEAAAPSYVLGFLRRVLRDRHMHDLMSARMRSLAVPDATQRFASSIVELALNFAKRNLSGRFGG